MDQPGDRAALLTTQQAAEALGCQRRTVRKYIARGELDAVQDEHGIYAIARTAVDDLRRRQQGLSGDVVDPGVSAGGQGTSAAVPADVAPVAADAYARHERLLEHLARRLEEVQAALAHDRAGALEAQLAAAHERTTALARECGRLQAELAHERARERDPLPPEFACGAAMTQSPAAANGTGDPAPLDTPDFSHTWPSEPGSGRWGRLFGWLRRL